jgi:Mg-chelatase subunit ChlD
LVPGLALAAEQEAVNEVDHRVEARVEGDLVHLTVQRTFHNPGQRYTEWVEWLALPEGGTVHGFTLEAQGQRTEGMLLAADEAQRRFDALRRRGKAAPRTAALLSEGASGVVDLWLWDVPPRASVTVRYVVRTRLEYTHGRSSFTYPEPTDARAVRPVLTVAPPHPGADICLARPEEPAEEPAGTTRPQTRELEASWEAAPFQGIDARAGLIPWESGSLGFVQLRAAKHLSRAPERARVVFVVDASHSVGPKGIARQLAFTETYLQRLPDAMAEVVVFRRSAQRLFGRFVRASDWKASLADVPSARLEAGNGSHLDEGLRLAQQVLSDGHGPARVLVLSDGLLRQAFEPVPPSPTTSAPEAAVHFLRLVNRKGTEPVHAKLSEPPVRSACGTRLVLYSSRDLPPEDLEALVRPVRLEQVRLEDEQGVRLVELNNLEEGEWLRAWLPRPEAPVRRLMLQGQRWGCPSSTPVEVDPALSADVGRNAYAWNASDFGPKFTERELPPGELREQLAKSGDWISSARSFLAIPSGAAASSDRPDAPPDEGVEGGVVGGVTGGTILCGIGPRVRTSQPERPAELTRLVQAATSTCHRQGGSTPLQVRVEATGDEIVDVEVTGAASTAQATCVREATWALRLPPLFDDGLKAVYSVKPLP